MKNGITYKEKIIPYLITLFGLFLIFMSLKTFIHSVDLYKTYRIERESFHGPIYAARYFYEFIISIILLLHGLILIKRNNFIFKVLLIFSLAISLFHLLSSLVTFIYCLIINCYSDYQILEFAGILFFAILTSEYYEYDWKKEIKNLSYKNIIVSIIVIFIINRILSVL